jgi:hypothetical protein
LERTAGDLVWDKVRKDFAWDETTALPPLLARAFQGEEPLYQDLRWARQEDKKCIFRANNDKTARLWNLSAENQAANSAVLHDHETSELVCQSFLGSY